MADDVIIVDVSKWQLVTEEACQHVHAFFVKASQGEKKYNPDPKLESHYKVIRNCSNVVWAPYHYFWRSDRVDNGKRQAENLAAVLGALIDTHGGKISDLEWQGKPLIWLDVDPVQTGLGEPNVSQNQMENQIWKFINNVDSLLGAEVGIYTSLYAWQSVTGTSRTTDIPRDRPLWVSNPRTSGKPSMPWDWVKRYGVDCWKIWQYSFTGKIPGIMKPDKPGTQASVDLNRANGNLAWFNATFKTKLTPKGEVIITPPPPPTEPPVVVLPDRVEIEMAGDLRLNIRTSPFGQVVAQTWDGIQFEVFAYTLDAQKRPWWKIGPEMYIASWYTREV